MKNGIKRPRGRPEGRADRAHVHIEIDPPVRKRIAALAKREERTFSAQVRILLDTALRTTEGV